MTVEEMRALRDERIREELEAITRRIEAGAASYADAQRFAGVTGRVVGDILSREICALFPSGKADRATIEMLLPPMLRDNYDIVTSITKQVQEGLNRKAGLHLKAVKPVYNKKRANGMVAEMIKTKAAAEKAPVVAQQIENAARAIVDDFVRTNVATHYHAGLAAKITRTATGKCCPWCGDLAGTYDYPNVPKDVYRRHTNCDCLVTYDPGDGARRRRDVWSKKIVSDDRAAERIQQLSQIAAQRKERDKTRREALYERVKK